MSTLLAPMSPGELLDRLTILEIKSARIRDPEKLRNVRDELDLLCRLWDEAVPGAGLVGPQRAALKAVNEQLWGIEDAIREKEAAGEFDAAFIELARSVYTTNDHRAAVKREVNVRLGSRIIEEKSYSDYA